MANDNGAVRYAITLDDSKMQREASQVVDQFQQIGNEAKRQGAAVDQAFSSAAANIGKAFAAIGLASTLTELGKQVISIRGEFEKLEVAFDVMLGSADKSKTLMRELVQTAATTPFDLQGVANGAKQLLAYGTSAENVNETLVRLGNIASGLSIPLNDLVYLYGTTMTQGRLFTQDLRQFMGRGIPLADELAKQFGVTKDKVGELVTAGKVGFPQVQAAIEAMTNEGGKFYGLMERQSKTIAGQVSNIGDAIDTVFNEIGKSNSGIISDALSGVSTLLDHYQDLGTLLMTVVAAYGEYKASLMLISGYHSMIAAQEAAIETQRQTSLATLIAETAAVESETTAEVANTSGKTAAVTAIDAKIVAMEQELAAAVAATTANYNAATAEAARAALALEAAEQKTVALTNEYAATAALLSGEQLETAENAMNTATVEQNAAARQLQAARANVAAAALAKETAAQKLSTFQTKTDTIAKTANTAATGLMTQATKMATTAFNALKTAIATNPIGMAAVALTTIIGALTLFKSKMGEATSVSKTFGDSIATDTNRLKNYKVTLETAEKGTKTYNDAMSGLVSLGKDYNVTIETQDGSVKNLTDSYDALTQAIKNSVAAELLAESSSKAREDAMSAESEAMEALVDAASKAYTIEEQGTAKYRKDIESIQSITTATWNMISQDVMSKSEEMANAFAKGQEQGAAAIESEVEQIESMLTALGVTDKEIDTFHSQIVRYVTSAAEGFQTAYTEMQRTEAQIRGLSGATSDLAQTTEETVDYASLGYDQLKEKASDIEQKINLINASTTAPKVDDTELQKLKGLLEEINTLMPSKVAQGSDAELSKRMTNLKTERDSKEFGSTEWKELNEQIKAVDKTLKEHKKVYAETQNATSSKSSKKREQAAKKEEQAEKKRQTALDKAESETRALIQNNELLEAQALDEGGAKTVAVINANAAKQADAITKRMKTIQKANKDAQATGLNENGLTTEQQSAIDTAYKLNEDSRLRQIKEVQDAEDQALRDYIIEYGTYQEKKLAIAQDYAAKIQKATTAGEKLTLNQQMQSALADLDKSMGQQTNWQAIFSGLDTYSVEFLQKLKTQVKDALSSGDLSASDAEALGGSLDEINQQITARKNEWKSLFGLQIPELEKINQLEAEAAQAEELNQIAQENYNKALAEELEMRKQIANYLNETTGSNYTEDEITDEVVGKYMQSNSGDSVFSGMIDKWTKSKSAKQTTQAVAETAATNATVASEAAGGASGSGAALAATDAIIHGINDNLQSVSEMIDEFGLEGTSFGQGMKSFAESSQYATDAFDSLKSGDFAGVALNLNNALGSLGTAFGKWGFGGGLFGESDVDLAKDIERLTAVNDELISAIDNLAEIMEDSSVADATSVYEQQKSDLEESMANTQEMMARSAAAYNNGFLGIGGKHSSSSKINDAMSDEDWARVSEKAGVTVTSAADFFNLTSEQMANVRNYATDLYSKIKQYADDGYADAAQYMDTYTEYYEELTEIENAWREKLTSTSFDDLTSTFKSALKEMEYDTKEFTENLNDMFADAALEGMLSASGGYYDQLQDWYEDFAAAMEDGQLDADDAESLKEAYDDIVDAAASEWKSLRDVLGIDTSSSQSASSGTWQSMSEDTGQELNGRFTALQATTVQIYEQMKADSETKTQSFSVLSEMNALIFTCSEYLNRIATNSDYLPTIDRTLERIRIHVEKL